VVTEALAVALGLTSRLVDFWLRSRKRSKCTLGTHFKNGKSYCASRWVGSRSIEHLAPILRCLSSYGRGH